MDPEEATFLIVGCGSIGQRHLGNLADLGVGGLVGVEPDPDRRSVVRDEFDVPFVASLDEALTDGPDVAVICVPNHLHVQTAKEAAEAGCHLFVEKPLSHTREGVQELCSIVDRRDLKTLVACNLRFHPAIQKIHQLVTEGAIGDLITIRAEGGHYLPDWHPDEDYRKLYSANADQGGGAILDYIHEIDYVRWLGGPINLVSGIATSASHLDTDTEDAAGILLRFENDIIGEIHADYVQREYSRSCHVIGDTGTIRWDWQRGTVSWYRAESDAHEQFSVDESWELNDMYVDEMRHFFAVLRGEESSMNPLDQGAAVLDVALAAKQSARTGEHIDPRAWSIECDD